MGSTIPLGNIVGIAEDVFLKGVVPLQGDLNADALLSVILEVKRAVDGCLIEIEVIDKGPGFPEAELKNVFKKFFRVDGSKTGGLGLGLSIAKGFVEAHKGTISVNNIKPQGARFTIRIPSEMPHIDNF